MYVAGGRRGSGEAAVMLLEGLQSGRIRGEEDVAVSGTVMHACTLGPSNPTSGDLS